MNTTGCQGLATVGSQWKTSVSAVFFLSCMEMEDKKTVPACRLLSVHLPGLSDLCLAHTYTLTYRSPGVLANQILEDQSGFCLYLFCLSLFYFPRYKSQTTHARTVRHGSSSFPGQSVNKVSTVSSPPTFTHLNRKRWEAKRSNQLTTGGRCAAIDRPVEQNMKVSDPQNQAYTNTGHTNSSITPFLIIKISHI